MEASELVQGATVYSSRGLGRFVGIDEKTGMAKVEIKTRKGTQTANEFVHHLKPIKFDAGATVVRKRPHQGQKLEGQVIRVIDHEQVEVRWQGALQLVTVLVSEVMSPAEYKARQASKCLHV